MEPDVSSVQRSCEVLMRKQWGHYEYESWFPQLLCQQRLKEWTTVEALRWTTVQLCKHSHEFKQTYSRTTIKTLCRKIIKHQFPHNLVDVKQKNNLKLHELHCEGFWRLLSQTLLQLFVVVSMSHAALCQLLLCNMNMHITDVSFWLMLLQLRTSLFLHFFFYAGDVKTVRDFIFSTLLCTPDCSCTKLYMFIIILPLVISKNI